LLDFPVHTGLRAPLTLEQEGRADCGLPRILVQFEEAEIRPYLPRKGLAAVALRGRPTLREGRQLASP
jgi:hypothetical protein